VHLRYVIGLPQLAVVCVRKWQCSHCLTSLVSLRMQMETALPKRKFRDFRICFTLFPESSCITTDMVSVSWVGSSRAPRDHKGPSMIDALWKAGFSLNFCCRMERGARTLFFQAHGAPWMSRQV